MSDLIDRQAAIDAYGDWYVEEGTEDGFIGTVKQLLEGFPSAQLGTDLAEVGTDCISRQAAIDEIKSHYRVDNDLLEVIAYKISKLPSVQPKIKTGHWIDDEFGSKCSCCGIHTHLDKFDKPMKFKHCSMCGAKMVEPQESEDT